MADEHEPANMDVTDGEGSSGGEPVVDPQNASPFEAPRLDLILEHRLPPLVREDDVDEE